MKEKHTGRTVAVLGGAGLLAWLLLRGGPAGKSSGQGKGTGKAPGDSAASRAVLPGSRCVVWIRAADRLEIDGVAADLPAAIARCRSVELAEVHATGGARQGFVSSIVAALHAAGVLPTMDGVTMEALLHVAGGVARGVR